jgi:SAM-dependent methyltransferase
MNLVDQFLREASLNDVPPTDYSQYFQGMQKGSSDKLFFLNQIKPDLVVDFGSANGAILAEIEKINPNIKLVGYDIAQPMIDISRKEHPNMYFTNSWTSIPSIARRYKNSCLLLSSVIHEVYSYSNSESIDKFWDEIFNSNFEYVVIRDTIPHEKIEKVKNFKKDVEQVKKIVDPILLSDYENRWGDISSNYKNFVRFVLMYRYRSNWERERLEDYLPLTYESFLKRISKKYKIIYNKNYKFKPIQQSFQKDFGISLRQDLHLKIILRRT